MSLAPAAQELAFEKFHRENPDVYSLYLEFAREWQKHKPGHVMSIALLTERIRWESTLRTVGDKYKINNNHRAYYARMLMEHAPGWRFRTRGA